MSLINLYDVKGHQINVKSLDLFGLKLHVPSPSYTLETETVDGGGTIVIDKTLNPRELIAEFFTKSGGYVDSLYLRDDLYAILNNGDSVYAGESKLSGKRWLVHADEWMPDRINTRVQRFSVPLFAPTGKAESVNMMTRTFNSVNFVYHNEGNVLIDMRHQEETEITFKGASNGLSIKNITTGDEWKYTESTTASDTILLKGVRSFKNGQSIFGKTNHRLISLSVGNNEFKITGNTGAFELTIRTRFYFL